MKTKIYISLIWGIIIPCFCSCSEESDRSSMNPNIICTASTVPWDSTEVSTRGPMPARTANIVPLTSLEGEDSEDLCLLVETGIAGNEVDNNIETMHADRYQDMTRGTVKESFAANEKFKFSAFVSGADQTDYAYYNEADGWFKVNTAGLTNVTCELSKTGYWPSNVKVIQFYAWWPYGADSGVTFNKSAKSIDFVCKPTSETQQDLLYASTLPLNYVVDQELGVHLEFKHALTAVRVQAGEGMPSGITIASITLKGFSDTGTFLPSVGAWVVEDLSKDFTVSNLNKTPNSSTTMLNDGNKTFLMIPQNLEGKQMVITTTGGKTFVANLSGLNAWAPGTTVTYTIAKRQSAEYRFYHNINLSYFYSVNNSATLTSVSFSMCSYKIIPNGESATYEKVKWKATEFSTDNVTFQKPTSNTWNWITNANEIIGEGSTGQGNFSSAVIRFDVNTPTLSGVAYENDQILKNNNVETERIDLSRRDTRGNILSASNTANCYVVSAGGTYQFPAVYGNGIVDGREDANTYNYSNFINMRGQKPTSAYIYLDQNSSLHPTSAKLIWNESNLDNVIKNVSYNSSTKMIEFEVDKDNIVQGNAVIGLYDAANGTGNLLWSWHIWITPIMSSTDSSVDTGNATYYFSPDNLGMIYTGYLNYYPLRGVYMKCQQIDDDENVIPNTKSYVIHYYQGVYTTGIASFYYPTYKFGSKDIIPSTSSTITGSPIYMSIPNTGNNLWNGNITTQLGFNDLPVQKTIYDPCPYGYHMPASNAFSAFTDYDSWELGRTYGNVRFRCVSSGATYWSAVPYNTNDGCSFRIANEVSIPNNHTSKTTNCVVRPVAN